MDEYRPYKCGLDPDRDLSTLSSRQRRTYRRLIERHALGGCDTYCHIPPEAEPKTLPVPPLRLEEREDPDEGLTLESIPALEEGWDLPVNSKERQKTRGSYYGSHRGLTSRVRLTPLFLTPVELLANSKEFRWVDNSVVGIGQIFIFDSSADWGLPFQPAQAIRAECMLQLVAGLKKKLTLEPDRALEKRVRRYYRNLKLLQFQRATFDALMLAYQQVRKIRSEKNPHCSSTSFLRSDDVRAVNRFKAGVVRNPEDAAMRLKKLASGLRGWYFDRPKPHDHLGRPIRSKREALAFSYAARSVPAPLNNTGDGIVSLVKRLTSEPVPRVPDWKPFVAKLLKRLSKECTKPANLRTAPSGHAALGYSRARGGHVAAVSDLTCIGYFLMQGLIPWEDAFENVEYEHLFRQSLFDVNRFDYAFGAGVNAPLLRLRYLGTRQEGYDSLLQSSGAGSRHQAALMRGCMWVMDQIDHVPVLPIEAGEKGMKTRFPTCSLSACNLMQQMLRRVIDHILVNDPRMAECFGADVPGQFTSTSQFYSQDMSFATDLHPHWLTREVYEALVPLDQRLEIFLPYFDKIFGPKRITLRFRTGPICDLSTLDLPDCSDAELPVQEAPLLPEAIRAVDPDSVMTRKTVRGRVPRAHLYEAMVFLSEYRKWLRLLSSPAAGPLTTVGAMMGDPTSFPVMPIMSAYAARKARHSRLDGKLTGDDAAFSGFGKNKVAPYERAMASLGGVISSSKTEWHKKKALFCEVPYVDGHRQKFTFLSNWVAPPGGSKGEINWLNQSLTVVQQNRNQGVRPGEGLWEYSPMWRMQQAAFLLGLPIAAEPGFGGALHPKFPRTSYGQHGKWIGYLATMTQAQMIAGAGLTLLPSPFQDLRLKAADRVVGDGFRRKAEIQEHQRLVDLYKEHGIDPNELGPPPPPIFSSDASTPAGLAKPSLEEVCDQAAAPLISASLYHRGPVVVRHAPSILRMARVFRARIGRAPPKYFRYTAVRDEIKKRTELYVSRAYRPPTSQKVSYGLLPADPPSRYSATRWIRGRVEFR
jgi:hypothetical protein